METILCADIGGTNSRLLLYEISAHDPIELPVTAASGRLILRQQYENQNFDTFISVVKTFLYQARVSKPPKTACFAVAGPVRNNIAKLTNRREWTLDGSDIAKELGIKSVKLVNDFVAAGYGLLTLNKETECVTIQKGKAQSDAPIACIGAGTGLGECFLAPDSSGQYTCFPCEGGHTEYSPRDDLEIAFFRFLKAKFNQKHRVSVERVVSGTGLVNIFEFLCNTFPDDVNSKIMDEVNAAGDKKGAIIAGYQESDQLCRETMRIFIGAYGAEAGSAALKWLPYGGLFLAGGLTPKNINAIKKETFMEAFMDKGRVSGMLVDIPVYAVLVEDIGERGAQLVAYKEFQLITSKAPSRGSDRKKVAERNVSAIITSAIAASLFFAIGWKTK